MSAVEFQHSLANLWVSYLNSHGVQRHIAQFQHSLANLWVSYPEVLDIWQKWREEFQHSLANLWVSYR